jgi:hypothetical protein
MAAFTDSLWRLVVKAHISVAPSPARPARSARRAQRIAPSLSVTHPCETAVPSTPPTFSGPCTAIWTGPPANSCRTGERALRASAKGAPASPGRGRRRSGDAYGAPATRRACGSSDFPPSQTIAATRTAVPVRTPSTPIETGVNRGCGADAGGRERSAACAGLGRGSHETERQRRGGRSRAEEEQCERDRVANSQRSEEQEARDRPQDRARGHERPRLRGVPERGAAVLTQRPSRQCDARRLAATAAEP